MATTFDDLFGGKFLKAEDLPTDEDLVLTIKSHRIEPIGQSKDEKLALSFREIDKELVCNKTNAATLAGLYGKEFDDWRGKKIIVFLDDVNFQGKMVPAVRVRPRLPKSGKPVSKQLEELGYQPEPEPEPEAEPEY